MLVSFLFYTKLISSSHNIFISKSHNEPITIGYRLIVTQFRIHIISRIFYFLKSNHFRFMRKCKNRSSCILKIKNFCITIICGIHFLQTRICIQHGLSCFHTVILYQFAGNANPLAALKCTQFYFRIGMQLLGNILLLASLDVQLASSSLNTASASAFFATSPQSGMHSCSTKQNIRFMSFIMHFSFPKLFFLLLPE